MTSNGSVDPGAAIAGLSRLVEVVQRRIDELQRKVRPLEQLPQVVAGLAAAGAPAKRAVPAVVPTWLAGVHTTAAAATLLRDLDEWVRVVFLRYSDTDAFPRECWPFPPRRSRGAAMAAVSVAGRL